MRSRRVAAIWLAGASRSPISMCAPVAMWLRGAPKEVSCEILLMSATWILKARERPARQKIDGGR